MPERRKDPRTLPVQLNVAIPWQLREDLYLIAERQNTSLTSVVRQAIMKGLSKELSEVMVDRTRAEGATK